MGKRANGEGTIYRRRDGRWTARLSLPGGRRKDFFGKTRQEVADKLGAALKQIHDGQPVVAERLSVGQFLKDWTEHARPSLRPESFRRYDDYIRLHLAPELGSIRLSRLTPQQVQGVYSRKLSSGLSGTSVQLLHGVLHKALDQAVRWGLTVRNVADLVDAPQRSTPQMRTLTASEALRLLQATRGDRLEAMYVLAITCGLRVGELQALRWRDIDLAEGWLNVTATLLDVSDRSPVLGEPKTSNSRRQVQLSQLAVGSLRGHRAAQLAERLQVGSEWEDHDLVFTNQRGHPLDGNNFRARAFRPLLDRAGLPPIRFHDLRHTAATLLMVQGVPTKVASEMLGHADITTTLRTYSHVLPGMQQQAADVMDRLFNVNG